VTASLRARQAEHEKENNQMALVTASLSVRQTEIEQK